MGWLMNFGALRDIMRLGVHQWLKPFSPPPRLTRELRMKKNYRAPTSPKSRPVAVSTRHPRRCGSRDGFRQRGGRRLCSGMVVSANAGKCGISILAGGASSRMGRDKSQLRLGSRTLLGHIRAEARKVVETVRIIRRDLVPSCGPLGGIYTGLATSQSEAEIFLACDMPFVSASLLEELRGCWGRGGRAIFVETDLAAAGEVAGIAASGDRRAAVGLPCLVPVRDLSVVEEQIQKRSFSLQKLAVALRARIFRPAPGREWELFNLNTRADWQAARQHWKQRRDSAEKSGL